MAAVTTYYAIHGHGPRACWNCDRSPCKCNHRSTKRSAKAIWRREIEVASEPEEAADLRPFYWRIEAV